MKYSSQMCGVLFTLLTVGGTVGATKANEQQINIADAGSHLVKLETNDETIYVAASDVDFIYAPKDENGNYSVEVFSVNSISGEQTKVIEVRITKQVLADFVAEVNKYRK
jgi:hypothetical protein